MTRRQILIGTISCLVVLSWQPAHALPAAADDLTCFGKPATITGTEGDDVLVGTPGDDVIVGLGGNDTIEPQRGNDLVCGGEGNDSIFDKPDLQTDGDSFQQSGDDKFSGGPGDDSLGYSFSDGADQLFGDDGNDLLDLGTSPMVGWGGPGADSFFDSDAGGGQQMFGGPGNDSWSNEEFQSNGFDRFYGGDGNDHVSLQIAMNVEVHGNRGDDTLEGTGDLGLDNTVFYGGVGNDHLAGVAADKGSALRGGPGADQMFGMGLKTYGGTGPDTIAGDEAFGGPGDDTLRGLPGASNDLLSGGRGNDSLSGGDGNDRLLGRAGNDTLHGNRGNDVLLGGLGTDTNNGGLGTDLCRSPASGPRASSCER